MTPAHSQRSGCKACFKNNDKCSLVEDAHAYPCISCDEAGFDCEFLVTPELKKSCERCKEKGLGCSYRFNGGKGVTSCNACVIAEVICLAVPLKPSAMLKMGPAGYSSAALLGQKRVYVACNQCRNGSKKCTLKRDQPGPCAQCRKVGEDCTFVHIPVGATNTSESVAAAPKPRSSQKIGGKRRARCRKKKEQNLDAIHSPGRPGGRNEKTLGAESFHYGAGRKKPSTLRNEQERRKVQTRKKQQKKRAQKRSTLPSDPVTPNSSPPLGTTNAIPHIRIKTAFTHPISFNYVPDVVGHSPCSWCSSPFFGLFGHGEIDVEVIPYPAVNGHGYEEVVDGHSINGKELSQMCVSCTTQRVAIMGCNHHEFEPLELDPRLLVRGEMEKSAQALLVNDTAGGELAEQTKWCSICPSAAAFRCWTPTLLDEAGCGLQVCENCNDLLCKIGKDSRDTTEALNRTIHYAAKDLFNYEYGVRADASFLTTSGELNVRIQKGFGAGPFKEDVDEPAGTEGDNGGSSRTSLR